ncbi:MAG: hypothetical protein QM626_10920 [Microbacterium sp.]|uniref:hypothetical protein n=1 Tax=Microbacterium sp. TaxID=51671 RepID=UPI0039E724DD
MSVVSTARTTGIRTSVSLSCASPAAWAAGLVATAMGAGAVVSATSSIGARSMGVGLVMLGLGALVWGAGALRAGRPVTPRTAVAGGICIIVLAAGMLLVAPTHTSVFAVATVVAVVVPVALVTAGAARRGIPAPAAPSVRVLVVAALILGVVVTPILASVQNAVIIDDLGNLPVIPGHTGH